MNREKWESAYHLARLATCPGIGFDGEVFEVKAYRQLHGLIQSGLLTRKDFNIAFTCAERHRWPFDKLDIFRQRFRDVKHDIALNRGEPAY